MRDRLKPLQVTLKQRTEPVAENTNRTDVDISRYDPTLPQENVIFWGTPVSDSTSLLQRFRTLLWFYPDHLAIIIHRLRPISYLALYIGALLLGIKTIVYAENNPNSLFGVPPRQTLIEGAVGSITSLNPLYVTNNQIDRDLQALIFDRFIGRGPDGNPTPDLASSWAISEDGAEYTFFLRDDVTWHDGNKFNADDVIFTFTTIQSLADQDSYADEFADVVFTKIDDFTLQIKLPELNPTFMNSLSFPILPEHLFRGISPSAIRYASYNNYPVGTGPFKIISNTEKSILLMRNEDYFNGVPKLQTIEYRFFPTEEEALLALRQFQIHTLVHASDETVEALDGYKAYTINRFETPLRQKLIYVNLRNQGPLASVNVRHALSAATDRDTLVSRIPSGGTPVYGTIPTSSWAYTETSDHYAYDTERAKAFLDQEGWILPQDENIFSAIRTKDGQPLTLTLTFLENNTNFLIAEELQSQWLAIGISLILEPQSYERISSETVPRRNFDLLLFEVEYTPDPDRYNLWHSTKNDYPGLNLSGYSSQRVDLVLERARKTIDTEKRKNDYSIIDRALMNDMPAIYLYSPTFTFIANTHVQGIELAEATLPQHRYNNVQEWYITKTKLGWRNWQTR